MDMTPHPVCGHLEYPDRHVESSPCLRCLKQIEKEYASDQPHPICGCLKPVWSFRKDGGPCGWCLKDIEREYGIVPDPARNRPPPTAEDFRLWRGPKLEATDWVEMHPARVAREPKGWIDALTEWRQQLRDITQMSGLTDLPPQPKREDYLDPQPQRKP